MARFVSDVKRGQHWRDRNGHYRVMAVAEGYAMIRRKGCAPFVRSAKEIERNDTRLAVASTTPPEAPGHGECSPARRRD